MLVRCLVLACLLLLCACQKEDYAKAHEKGVGEIAPSLLPQEQKPALVIWAGVDPLGKMARVLERLVSVQNGRNKDRWATLQYIPKESLRARALDAGRAELPPDVIIAPSSLARQMWAAGLAMNLDASVQAKISREGMYDTAWATVETTQGLCGVPLCGEMRLRYVNLDTMREKGLTTQSLGAAPSGEADWARFVKGESVQCEASSDRLGELFRSRPSFAWRAEAVAGSYETLSLVVRAGSEKPVSAMMPLIEASQEGGLGALLWTECSKLPVHPAEYAPERAKAFEDIEPWIAEWMRVAVSK